MLELGAAFLEVALEGSILKAFSEGVFGETLLEERERAVQPIVSILILIGLLVVVLDGVLAIGLREAGRTFMILLGILFPNRKFRTRRRTSLKIGTGMPLHVLLRESRRQLLGR